MSVQPNGQTNGQAVPPPAPATVPATTERREPSLIATLAGRYGMAAKAFEIMVRGTMMPAGASDAEMMACLAIAKGYDLNPITKEVYFMKTRAGSIQPIISVDGWLSLCNRHPQFDGIDFAEHLDDSRQLMAITARIYRKDRSRPTEVTEYMAECRGSGGGWQKTPCRMLRHRALTQAARYAFGFAGVMDRDEYDQWQVSEPSREPRDVTPPAPAKAAPQRPAPPPAPEPEPAQEVAPTAPPGAEAEDVFPGDLPSPSAAPDSSKLPYAARQFLRNLETAFAKIDSLDALNEVWLRSEDDVAKHECYAQAQELYDIAEKRIAD